MGLFTPSAEQVARSQQLMRQLDALNARYGRNTVRYASVGPPNAAWQGRCVARSDGYTTDWEKLWHIGG
jgi:DNA polymerase V